MFEKFLQDIGLNEKEAKVYLELLRVDDASVIEISKKTKINRTTVYNVISSLEEKGLVSETTLDKKTHYLAESPERLSAFAEKQKISYEEKVQRVKDIIPQLKSQNKTNGSRPIVRYFEGKEGIVAANEEVYQKTPAREIRLMYSKDLLHKVFSEKEIQGFKKKRLSKDVHAKVIYGAKHEEIPSDTTSDRIRIDTSKYPVSCDIAIYNDKVRVAIMKKHLSGIFIQSREFAETMRSLFDVAHNSLKEDNKIGRW